MACWPGASVWALLSLVLAALVCHFLFYLVPALLGQKTGLPLYIVGTSTFGAQGGFLLPGFLMGLLQFGWLGREHLLLVRWLLSDASSPLPAQVIMVVWGVLAAFVGLKGIQYVGQGGHLPAPDPAGHPAHPLRQDRSAASAASSRPSSSRPTRPSPPMPRRRSSAFGVLAFVLTYVVGFFATAGAAGVDFGTNSRDASDVADGRPRRASPWPSS